MTTNKPPRGENTPKNKPPESKTQVQQESPHKQNKGQPLEHPDIEIKETAPLSPTEILPQKFAPER